MKRIRKNYRSNVTVVFDEYHKESAKSHEHLRTKYVPQNCIVNIVDNQVLGLVAVVANDTYIAVMLIHHWQEKMAEVYFLQEQWI